MSPFAWKNHRVYQPKSGIYILLLLVLLPTFFVMKTGAQDEEPKPDLPDYEIVSVETGPTATTVIVNIFADKDTFISSNMPNNNFGNAFESRTGRDTTFGATRTMMRFDLDPIPNKATINSAALNIYQSSYTPSQDTPYLIQTRFLDSDWGEYAVTWNNNVPKWGDVMGTIEVSTGVGWRVFDVKNMLQEWANGKANYGLVLQGSNENTVRSRNFATRETANRPFITVTYTNDVDTCAPTATLNDLPAWSKTTFTVEWSATDCGIPTSGVKSYDLQYSLDDINWTDWKTDITETSATWSNTTHNTQYYFRVRARDEADNVGSFTASKSTRVDSQAPHSTTIKVNVIANTYFAFPNFITTWSAADNGSGLKEYEILIRDSNGGSKTKKFPANITSDAFVGAVVGYSYTLQVRAIDNAENVSEWSTPDSVTIINDPSSVVLPLADSPITTKTSFQVSWLGFATNSINDYTIYYRVAPSSNWIPWETFTGLVTFATFDAKTVIPDYNDETINIQFQATAKANNSNPEPLQSNGVEASIIVDPLNTMTNRTYLPIIHNQ